MARTVKEKSPLHMTVTFTDENGDPLIPQTVDWRLDNHDTDAEIVPWTALGGISSSMVVVIPATNNVIEDESNVREERSFGIRVNSGQGSEAHDEFHYHIINLHGPSGP